MTFSLTRPSSPVNNGSPHTEEDLAHLPRMDPGPMSLPESKERPGLEIHLDHEFLVLKGTGNDVESARLTGHVALYLAESTPIKEITLHFRGKARLPVSPHESITLNNSASTYIVCNHDWSFLEGEKKHSHTLKAGRHFFPFQLQVGGSLPSSVYTTAFGGASVTYKLRAHAVRSGLNSNLQAVAPVHILRSFSAEALEYQQTLEIENTWPEKLMYSIMIPHKAWAASDTITALVKFSPLVKGVGVVTVNTTINETTKLHAGRVSQEYTRVVASSRHEIVGGKAVEASDRPRPATPGTAMVVNTPGPASGGGYFSLPVNAEAGPSRLADDNNSVGNRSNNTSDLELQGSDDVVTYLSIVVPTNITPTHTLDPITVSHRLRWSILIVNPDGHTSELRCSLPIHLLDQRLLNEARAHTAATRRLLIGGPEVPPAAVEEEVELPSYTSHVRDRVANMYLPEAATMRVTNPLSSSSSGMHTPAILSRSGHASPLDANYLSHLPHAPGSGDSTPLDWLNSELLLTMESNGRPSDAPASGTTSDSDPPSRNNSHPPSSRPSRRGSRASSPERERETSSPGDGTIIHSSHASRNLQGLFAASMKPFTALAHPHWPRSSSHTSLSSLTASSSAASLHAQAAGGSSGSIEQRRARTLTMTETNPTMLQRAYTEVPGYSFASRGFIGGVPPLSSMQGLPSYEETERTHSLPSTPALR